MLYTIFEAVISVIALLLCVLPHEIAHGYTAYLMGDNTAKFMGRLSFNPLNHINPRYAGLILGGMFLTRLLSNIPFMSTIAGLLMWVGFVLLLKPVPINVSNFRDPKKGMAITALMGPLTNLVIAFLCCVIYRYTYNLQYLGGIIGTFFMTIALYNIQLAVFNLIPVPPLDGSRILFAFLPGRYYFKIMQYERYIMIGFLVLVWIGVLDALIMTGTLNVYRAFMTVVSMLPGSF